MSDFYRYFIVLGLVLGFSLQSQKDASAQEAAGGDIFDLIPFGTFASKVGQKQTFVCKSTIEPLECGNGSGGFVDNFYVMFIDIDQTPANSPLILFAIGSLDRLDANDCNAGSIQNIIVGFSDLPVSLQNSLMIPKGKKAVFHRVRVTNGNGSINVNAAQECVVPQSS